MWSVAVAFSGHIHLTVLVFDLSVLIDKESSSADPFDQIAHAIHGWQSNQDTKSRYKKLLL